MKSSKLLIPLILLFCAGIAQSQVTYPKGSLAGSTTVASLPLIGNSNILWDVRDGNPNCATGGGTTRVVCHWNGATYDTVSTSAGTVTNVSGTPNQISVATGTTTPVLSFPTNGIAANNVAPGFATTVTAGGNTTLTVASKGVQEFTGTLDQTVTLPVVSTLPQTGFQFVVINRSSDFVDVVSSAAATVQTMAANTTAIFTCRLLTGTTAASWSVTYIAGSGISGLTPNTIPKATSASTIGDSQITDNGTTVSLVGAANDKFVVVKNADEIPVFAIDTSANPTGRLGAADVGNGTNIFLNDGAKAITLTASTEILGLDGTAHTVSISAASAINVNSGTGVTTIGDVNNDFEGAQLQIDNSISGGKVSFSVNITPRTAANNTVGTALLPFQGLIVGNAANNSSQISSLATANRSNPLPDADGTIQLVGAANTGAVLTCLSNNTVLSTATGQVFTSPGNDGTPLTVAAEGAVGWVVTRAGTIRNLYVRTGTTAKVNTPATAIVVRKNSVDTTLTIAAMTQTTTTNSSDTTHSFTVVAGDVITVSLTTTGVAGVSTSIASITFELD